MEMIDRTIEESYEAPETLELASPLTGKIRVALDGSFRPNNVEKIISNLKKLESSQDEVGMWAQSTLKAMRDRSPTSLVVALELVRRGKTMSLGQALHMEYRMATSYCVRICLKSSTPVSQVPQNGASPDFVTGIRSVLVDRVKGRPNWQPSTVDAVSHKDVLSKFFNTNSKYLQHSKALEIPDSSKDSPTSDIVKYGLPSEAEVEQVVTGTHRTSSQVGLDVDQVMDTFKKLYPSKGGLEPKLSEVLSRKCEVVSDPGHFNHLRWIH